MDSHAVGCRASHESASEGVAFNLNMLWLSGDSIVQIQRLAMCRIAQRDWSHPDPPSGPRVHHPSTAGSTGPEPILVTSIFSEEFVEPAIGLEPMTC